MFPHGYHHNGFMETPALGTHICCYVGNPPVLNIVHKLAMSSQY